MKKILKVLLVLVLITAGAAGGFFVERMQPKKEAMETLLGDWVSEIDLTKTVAANAEAWLEDIEGVTVTTCDLEEKIGPFTLEVVEHYEIDENKNAVYTKTISQDSYEECVREAYQGISSVFRELIITRFKMAGLENADEESIDGLFEEVFGMSVVEYLNSQLPELVPSYTEVCERYTGNARKQVAE